MLGAFSAQSHTLVFAPPALIPCSFPMGINPRRGEEYIHCLCMYHWSTAADRSVRMPPPPSGEARAPLYGRHRLFSELARVTHTHTHWYSPRVHQRMHAPCPLSAPLSCLLVRRGAKGPGGIRKSPFGAGRSASLETTLRTRPVDLRVSRWGRGLSGFGRQPCSEPAVLMHGSAAGHR